MSGPADPEASADAVSPSGPVFRAEQKHLSPDTIRNFVTRARIVQDHSLAADKDHLSQLATHTWSIRVLTMGDDITYECQPFHFPPTEQVESAAARVRPIFVTSDGVWYEAVLSLLHQAVSANADMASIGRLLDQFRSADPDYPESLRGKSRGPGDPVSNHALAGAWLYGHLIHADARRQTYTSSTPLEATYYTASRTVAAMVLATVEALHFIEQLTVRGVLELAEDLFTDPVTVQGTEWTPPGKVTVYTAPLGQPPPAGVDSDLEAAGWSLLDPRES